jgi:hypothetical protein
MKSYGSTTKQLTKVALFIGALFIGVFSLIYTNSLVKELRLEEEKKVSIWAKAQERLAEAESEEELDFYYSIVEGNKTIPVILEGVDGSIIAHRNLDSLKSRNPEYVKNLLNEMKGGFEPIPIKIAEEEYSYLYYSDSYLLIKLRNYPFYQLAIIFLFLLVSYFAFKNSQKAEQNKVWVGLAKETAHQLGTPISSLMAWTELLDSDNAHANKETYREMRKDLKRLNTVTERFSKIGSPPVLQRTNINEVIFQTIEYMKTRSPKSVKYIFHARPEEIYVNLNVPLFEWVLENLCKNSIDAMDGGGQIKFTIRQLKDKVVMDVSDTGGRIPKGNFKSIFNPGFTTKKRGWGLGLSLVRRIIRNYHKGQIFVRESIPNEKTTFRIMLKVAN